MYEIRLEVNIDVTKRDIKIETVYQIVFKAIAKNLPQYIELQSVKVIHPR